MLVTEDIERLVRAALPGATLAKVEKIQSLWGGYGDILRLHLQVCGANTDTANTDTKINTDTASLILKHIRFPQPAEHPRGWRSDFSHRRKLKSYQVEAYWYQHYAAHCGEFCPVPRCLGLEVTQGEMYLLLSDLASDGFPQQVSRISSAQLADCLSWLANFHGVFLQHSATGLWECGSYWHLDTRPDELAALQDTPLRRAAPLIDQALKQCAWQTLIHGDAKLANFCFAPPAGGGVRAGVAAVDFQYVGRGCGMKDVVYFLGSCLSDRECASAEQALLDHYFNALQRAVARHHPQVVFAELERAWRALFDVAWADFHRFLKGWSPEHWKLHSYSEGLTAAVVRRLLQSTVPGHN